MRRRHFLTGLALLPASTVVRLQKPSARPDDEGYWKEVRSHFFLPDDVAYLNNGTLGLSPRPVVDAMYRHMLETESVATRKYGEYPWWGYGPSLDIRTRLGKFVGAEASEIALTRNATEGMSTVAFGLDLKRDDAVLLSDEEHPGGRSAWYQRASRDGIEVRTFQLPRPASSTGEILERVERAITPRTRVISVSHITTMTGAILPVGEISRMARSKGILSLVDGAHAIGQIPLDLRQIGCDYYAASPHKWLYAPKGTGLLYCREGMAERLWCHTASGTWDQKKLGAERLTNIGTSNLSLLIGLLASIDFHEAIGSQLVYGRLQYLVGQVRKRMVAAFPKIELLNGPPPVFSSGMCKLGFSIDKMSPVAGKLWKERRIWLQAGDPDPALKLPSALRVSCPIYVRLEDIDRLVDALKKEKVS